MSETYYAGDKGDEVSDFSFNFKLGDTANIKIHLGLRLRRRSSKRATAATTTDAMTRSSPISSPRSPLDRDGLLRGTAEIAIETNIMSETYYAGDKGDEVSDFSFNFKLGDTANIKSTSVFVYGAELKRATAATTTDAMTRSLSYKFTQKPSLDRDGLLRGMERSPSRPTSCPRPTTQATRATRYRTSALTLNWATPPTSRSTSVFVYGAELKRATAATTTDAMTRSLSYKFTQKPSRPRRPITWDGDIAIETNIMSETYYAGDKGDEVSDFSFNFKLGDTANIKIHLGLRLRRRAQARHRRHHHRRHDPQPLL